MIVADTSALVAVVLGEPEAEAMLAALTREPAAVSAVSLVEAAIVVRARQGADAVRDLDLLVAGAIDQVLPFDRDQALLAVAAWQRFGKGRHTAALNFGDCCTYAAAKASDAPLLFKGDDFGHTDLAAVL